MKTPGSATFAKTPGVDPTVRPAASSGRMNSRTSLLMLAAVRKMMLSPHQRPRLAQLPRHLGPREVAAERRVRHPIVEGQRPQRLARRPPVDELSIRHQPAQTTTPTHPNRLASLNAPTNAPKISLKGGVVTSATDSKPLN
jgi:hypothetical protein